MSFHYISYRLLLILLSPLLLGHITWLAVSNRQWRYFSQRLGFGCSGIDQGRLWFHCASVGEVNTLLPLLKNLHRESPKLSFIITTNTITGASIVANAIEKQKLDCLSHCYLPFDWSFSVNRFLRKVKPCFLYVVETEIWPNLYTQCSNKDIPIYIINARLSSKTTSANDFVKKLLRYSLRKTDAIYARTDHDAAAYRSISGNDDLVAVSGNLKFTTALDESVTPQQLVPAGREYVLVASTHDDEELQVYQAWKHLERSELLLIAPRHPERSSAIVKKLNCDNIAIRSKQQPIEEDTEVFLLDTVGELKDYFADAKLVIMGGSFVAVGGHNILEPASRHRAIITGPYMENFVEELNFMKRQQAILQILSIDELAPLLQKLLDDDDYRREYESNTEKLSANVSRILDDYTALILSDHK